MRAATIAEKIAKGVAAAVEVGECLEWQGKFACKGATPVVGWFDREKKRTENESVPRALWEAENGPIPAGKLVYRSCCNNACVLQAHLKCGTRAEWARARKKAGATKHHEVTKLHLTLAARKRAGTTNSMDKARQVRSLAAAKVRTDEIASLTGVHPTMVAEIRQGRAWREFGGNVWQGLGA